MLSQQLTRVRERIQQACARASRDPSSVTLIGVTKGVAVEAIREILALGVTEIGENRVQEASTKHSALRIPHSALRWHLIGHLQRNKADDAVRLFDVIHSVDSLRLLEALERQAAKAGRSVEVLIQVNVSGEATKSGCRPDEATTLAEAVLGSRHLTLKGLMTLAPFSDNPEDARPHFRRLRELRDQLEQRFHSSLVTRHSSLLLSMGMSQDFEVAIEEGADAVRIGTALFGEKGSDAFQSGTSA